MKSIRTTGSAPTLKALRRGPACIALERFDEALTVAEREHVRTCPRCHTEFALWQKFNEATSVPEGSAAEQWIVAELGRRRGPSNDAVGSYSRKPMWLRIPAWSAAAAAVALVATLGYVTRSRAPVVRGFPDAKMTYRSGQLRVISPVDDVNVVPTALEWEKLPDAERYDVTMLEVDRSPFWEATVSGTRLALPQSVIERLVPGKTVLWEVTARNSSGATLASSGLLRFRVKMNSPGG